MAGIWKKKILPVLLTLVLAAAGTPFYAPAAAAQNTADEDIALIKQRIKDYYLTPEFDAWNAGTDVYYYVSKAGDYLASQQGDGSWSDVNYFDTTTSANRLIWSPYHALTRMLAMASAYCLPGGQWYQDPAMLAGVEKALIHWASVSNPAAPAGFVGPWSVNWWENGNGVQLRFMKIGVFLEGKLSTTAMNIIINKLNASGSGETGQNGMSSYQNAVYRALLEKNASRLTINVAGVARCLTVQTGAATIEGIQPDNSYYTHGDLYYAHGYGMQLFNDMAFWIYILRDTQFAVPTYALDNMAFFMLDGTRWTIRGDVIELQNGYAPPETLNDRFAEVYLDALGMMAVSDPARAADYTAVRDNILGTRPDSGVSGNKYMWRSQYMSQMRKNYAVNVKMDAPWMKPWEWRRDWPDGQTAYNLLYWTSSGTTTYVVEGHEYSDVTPVYDWAHTPGATAPYVLTTNMSMTTNSPFTAGVSNGQYGVTGYDMNKANTQAKKGYFFFENEVVALGAGIASTAAQPVNTTIDQNRSADVTVGGTPVPIGTDGAKYTTNWMHNDQVGYVFPTATDVYVSNKNQYGEPSLWPDDTQKAASNVFTAWIDHGTKPSGGFYAYIVLPDKTAAETAAYAANIPVTILSNTKTIQAVRDDSLKLTEIDFYAAGSLEYRPGQVITADKACVVMIDESGAEPLLYVAVGDHTERTDVTLTTKHDSATAVKTVLRTQTIPFAGQTMTAHEGDNTTVLASSSADGNQPYLTRDKNPSTVWKSAAAGEQWVTVMDDNKTAGRIQEAEITWGQNYATHYKVQISSDGRRWYDVAEITDGKGGTETVPIGDIGLYIRVVCLEGVSGNGYEIAEIGEIVSDNAVMRFSGLEKLYMLQDNDRLIAGSPITADGGTADLTKYNKNNLYLCMNLYLDWDDPTLEQLNMSGITGTFTLRCVDYTDPTVTGTEHRAGWNSNALGLKKGMNRLYLPLAPLMDGTSGSQYYYLGKMDWTTVNRIQYNIAGLGKLYPGVFFTMDVTGVRVELIGDYQFELQNLLAKNFDAGNYTEDSYANYLAVRTAAADALAAATDPAGLKDVVRDLNLAINGLIPFIPPEIPYGDVNGDGLINTIDARLVLQHIVGKAVLGEDAKAAADVNRDGAVNTVDARLILQKIVGKITDFI